MKGHPNLTTVLGYCKEDHLKNGVIILSIIFVEAFTCVPSLCFPFLLEHVKNRWSAALRT